MTDFSAIIFDLDGVIIDTEPLHARTKRMAFDHYGITVPEDMYAKFRGRTDLDMVKCAVEEFAPSSVEWREVLARKHELFNQFEHEIAMVAGAAEFIKLARGHFAKLGLVTSATRRNQEHAVQRFGLATYFDVIVTAEDITRTKPDPEPYRVAVTKLAISPQACLVLEDSIAGIVSANAAGCAVVAITTSFTSAELAEAAPSHIVSSYNELTSLLNRGRLGSPAPS